MDDIKATELFEASVVSNLAYIYMKGCAGIDLHGTPEVTPVMHIIIILLFQFCC